MDSYLIHALVRAFRNIIQRIDYKNGFAAKGFKDDSYQQFHVSKTCKFFYSPTCSLLKYSIRYLVP